MQKKKIHTYIVRMKRESPFSDSANSGTHARGSRPRQGMPKVGYPAMLLESNTGVRMCVCVTMLIGPEMLDNM